MLRKLAYFIYAHELPLGIIGFISTFLFYILFPGPVTLFRSGPLCVSWLCAFLIGDWISRHLKEGSIFPHRANQINKLRRVVLAALIMNFISDATGAWFLKLWYYPPIASPFIYLFFLAPVGYILFGLILYVFYRLLKRHWDRTVKRGRMTKLEKRMFMWIINAELIVGVVGVIISGFYYYHFVKLYSIVWYAINLKVVASVNIFVPLLLWISLFFLMEYACFILKRETLTRDLVRGNMLPFFSICIASVVCIILVEFFNAPLQVWTFTNWPYDSMRLLGVPLVAFILWPMQYLLLLPLVRLIDGKNEENVW
jgi:hypothetical protein